MNAASKFIKGILCKIYEFLKLIQETSLEI